MGGGEPMTCRQFSRLALGPPVVITCPILGRAADEFPGRRVMVVVDDRGVPLWCLEDDRRAREIATLARILFGGRLCERLAVED
jgi:hypothetical protein